MLLHATEVRCFVSSRVNPTSPQPQKLLAHACELMTTDLLVKVCVLGPLKSGKTLLCQTLAEQPGSSLYAPTAGCRCVRAIAHALKVTTIQSLRTHQHDCCLPCRIQVLGRELAHDSVKVQLWEVAGDGQCQAPWPVIAKVCIRGSALPHWTL
jgi:hypothetical protein